MTDHTGYHTTHTAASSKVLFIDSKDASALHAGTTHFTYVFRDSILVNKDEGVLISLLQASIPYSFYNIRPGVNDRIDIKYGAYSVTPTLTDILITIPPGNYTAISLANKFTAILDDALTGVPSATYTQNITYTPASNPSPPALKSKVAMEYDRDTQKFDFSIQRVDVNGDPEISTGIVVIFNLTHGAARQAHFDIEIGFDSDTADQSVYFAAKDSGVVGQVGEAGTIDLSQTPTLTPDTSLNGVLSSKNIADLNGSVHALYLRTNLPVISAMDSQTGGISQIIAKLPIDTGPGGIIFHEPKNTIHKSLIHTKAIKDITIRLTDDRNRIIDTNGLHISIALMFEFVSLRQSMPILDPRMNLRNLQQFIDSKKIKKKKKIKKNIKDRYNAPTETIKTSPQSNPKSANISRLPN